tara:strand:+ start:29483 stop:30160 length:678 start_codon:yes stop_codon:yes gene_type:complete
MPITLQQALFFIVACLLNNTLLPNRSLAADESQLTQLMALMEGEFDNAEQLKNAPSKEPAHEYDHLYQHRVRISSPALPGFWLYSQINKRSPDQGSTVYRQTVSEFFIDSKGLLRSRVWSFKDESMKKRGLPGTAFLQKLDKSQLIQKLSDDCLNTWHLRGMQFVGTIDPDSCVIQSRYQNEQRRLFSEEIVFDGGLWSREGAYRMNGELAFGLEENAFYRFQRQ